MLHHKIKSVSPLPGLRLLVHFENGDVKEYSVEPLFDQWEVFKLFLATPDLFDLVKVDAGGYGVYWNDEIDLDCNELWENGTSITDPFSNFLSSKDATDRWGLNDSTLRKAIARGKLADGIDCKKYGKQWIVTSTAMIREYGKEKAED